MFDYYVDDASCSMVSWDSKVPSFSYMPDSFSSLFVPTLDTTRLTYFLDTLVAKKHYVMFVGNTGETPFYKLFTCHVGSQHGTYSRWHQNLPCLPLVSAASIITSCLCHAYLLCYQISIQCRKAVHFGLQVLVRLPS